MLCGNLLVLVSTHPNDRWNDPWVIPFTKFRNRTLFSCGIAQYRIKRKSYQCKMQNERTNTLAEKSTKNSQIGKKKWNEWGIKYRIPLEYNFLACTLFWPTSDQVMVKKSQETISFKRRPEPPHTSVCKIYERKKGKFSWEHHVVEHTSWKVPWKADFNF